MRHTPQSCAGSGGKFGGYRALPSGPGNKRRTLGSLQRRVVMENLAQYRCYFLDSTGSLATDETIECSGEQEAVDMALTMLQRRPHYHGIELRKGARVVHMEVRIPEVPYFVMTSAQRMR
jgi:hypothetical protein